MREVPRPVLHSEGSGRYASGPTRVSPARFPLLGLTSTGSASSLFYGEGVMRDLYTLFTGRQYREELLQQGFQKEYVRVGPHTTRAHQPVYAGEVAVVARPLKYRPTEE